MTQAQVKEEFMNAKEFMPEPPRPLRRPLSKPEPYPVDALGNLLGGAAKAIQDKIQAPLAICCQSVMAVASLGAQAHADVLLPIGQTRPLSNYFVSVANSGERKTSSDNEAVKPVEEREMTLQAGYDAEYATWKNKQEAYEKQRNMVLNDKNYKTKESRAAALEEIGTPPLSPMTPMLTCPEPTFEGMCRLLMNGHPSLGIFSSEGGQFIGGYGMTEEHKLKTAAAISDAWDGKSIKRVRAGDGALIMRGKRISMHLMVQPGVARKLLSDRILADQGLLSRLLIAAPETTAGTRFWREAKPENTAALERYNTHMRALFEAPYPLAEGKQNELSPRTIRLTPKASKAFLGFCDHVEGLIGAGKTFEPIRALANKLPEHAVRLASVMAMVDKIESTELTETYFDRGVTLAQYYASEALRLADESHISADLELAIRLLHWLQHTWDQPLISLPDIYQRSLNAIRDKSTAARIVRIIEEEGWMVRQPQGATINGIPRKDVWKIVKEPKHDVLS